MRRAAAILVLCLATGRLLAPEHAIAYLPWEGAAEIYSKLISAIGAVESKHDTLAYNPVEQATGYFQIRPIRLEDYNKRTGNHYTMKDMFSYQVSEKIFVYYANMVGPYDQGRIARAWNGSGPMTEDYWKRVKTFLN